MATNTTDSRNQVRSAKLARVILPGLAFKSVMIGGGYATGRELVQFFHGAGPLGGVFGLLLCMSIFSIVCMLTLSLAKGLSLYDYKSFFERLLGRWWFVFEICFLLQCLVGLAVVNAAGSLILVQGFGAPELLAAALVVSSMASVATFGSTAVNRLFGIGSVVLYVVFAILIALMFGNYSEQILDNFASLSWSPVVAARGGIAYAGYNVLSIVVVLHVARSVATVGEAAVAGLLCGPLAIVPALLFFIAMTAFFPELPSQEIPSTFLTGQLALPALAVAFDLVVLLALVETGVGVIHAINERVSTSVNAHGRRWAPVHRLGLTIGLLAMAMYAAERIGLISLISKGYGTLTYIALAVFVLPVCTVGVMMLLRQVASGQVPEP